MARGRQFGSITTRVPAPAAATARARPLAIGSSTRPSVPTWRAAGADASARSIAAEERPGTDVSAVWNRYVAAPRSSSSATASVVGASVVSVNERSTPSAMSAPRSCCPNRSSDNRPRNATSPPRRAIVRDVLNGPPPGTAARWPSGWTMRSMRASPATTITAPILGHGANLATVQRQTDAVEVLDGPLDDPAALAGNLRDLRRINRWSGGVRLSADAIEALAAHREDVSLLDVGTGGADIPVALLDRARQR